MELGTDDGNGDWLYDEADVGGLPTPPPRGEGPYPHGHLMNQLDPVATTFQLILLTWVRVPDGRLGD